MLQKKTLQKALLGEFIKIHHKSSSVHLTSSNLIKGKQKDAVRHTHCSSYLLNIM